MSPSSLVAIGLGALLIYGLWAATKTRWTVRIVVDKGKIKSCHGLASARTRQIEEFFRRDVRSVDRLVVRARRDQNGYLHIKVTGSVDTGTQQQIRNFLITVI